MDHYKINMTVDIIYNYQVNGIKKEMKNSPILPSPLNH